jgi:hypothetical protein
MSTPQPAPKAEEAAAPRAYDPVALADSLASAAEKSAKLIGDFANRHSTGGHSLVTDELGVGKAFIRTSSSQYCKILLHYH